MSSRVARMPLVIPAGVDATIADGLLSVKGPLGSLSQAMSADVKVSRVEDRLEFEAVGESIQAKAMSDRPDCA